MGCLSAASLYPNRSGGGNWAVSNQVATRRYRLRPNTKKGVSRVSEPSKPERKRGSPIWETLAFSYPIRCHQMPPATLAIWCLFDARSFLGFVGAFLSPAPHLTSWPSYFLTFAFLACAAEP
jgi:hypothetical protein